MVPWGALVCGCATTLGACAIMVRWSELGLACGCWGRPPGGGWLGRMGACAIMVLASLPPPTGSTGACAIIVFSSELPPAGGTSGADDGGGPERIIGACAIMVRCSLPAGGPAIGGARLMTGASAIIVRCSEPAGGAAGGGPIGTCAIGRDGVPIMGTPPIGVW